MLERPTLTDVLVRESDVFIGNGLDPMRAHHASSRYRYSDILRHCNVLCLTRIVSYISLAVIDISEG